MLKTVASRLSWSSAGASRRPFSQGPLDGTFRRIFKTSRATNAPQIVFHGAPGKLPAGLLQPLRAIDEMPPGANPAELRDALEQHVLGPREGLERAWLMEKPYYGSVFVPTTGARSISDEFAIGPTAPEGHVFVIDLRMIAASGREYFDANREIPHGHPREHEYAILGEVPEEAVIGTYPVVRGQNGRPVGNIEELALNPGYRGNALDPADEL